MKDMLNLIQDTKDAGLLDDSTKFRTISRATIRFIDTKQIVWEGTYADYVQCFNGGLDEDNQKSYEVIFFS